MNHLALFELERLVQFLNVDFLVTLAAQIHLYPTLIRVIKSKVGETFENKIASKFAIYSPKKVQVEFSRNVLRVIIGCLQYGRLFLHIGSDQHIITVA